jgi:hypothetical protein
MRQTGKNVIRNIKILEAIMFTLKLKEIKCEVDSAGSGYGPAAFSFVRVNAFGNYKRSKIS